MSGVVADLRALFTESNPPELNADGEFDNPTINGFLSRNNVAVRYKEGRQDLATIDSAMNNFKCSKDDAAAKYNQLGQAGAQSYKGPQPHDARSSDGLCGPKRGIR